MPFLTVIVYLNEIWDFGIGKMKVFKVLKVRFYLKNVGNVNSTL